MPVFSKPSSQDKTEYLSPWNQTACRSYMRRALYFPIDNASWAVVVAQLQQALNSLAQQRVDLAGTLEVSGSHPTKPGRVLLSTPTPAEASITLETADRICWQDGDTYETIKAQGFPQMDFKYTGHFQDTGDFKDTSTPIPACKAITSFTDGGMVFVLFLHHSLVDGDGMGMVLDALAELTRDPKASVRLPSRALPSNFRAQILREKQNENGAASESAEQIVGDCHEYSILPSLTGPNVREFHSGGKPWDEIKAHMHSTIFDFDVQKLKALAALLQEALGRPSPPTLFNIIAALSWAHITMARLESEAGFYTDRPQTGDSDLAQITLTMNCKGRVPGAKESYFGNATISPRAAVSVQTLQTVCRKNVNFQIFDMVSEVRDPRCPSSPAALRSRKRKCLRDLAGVVYTIQDALAAVDQDYVARRTALFEALPSPQMLTQNRDPRSPLVLFTNNWRYIGGDTEWDLTGQGALLKPDAIRRAESMGDICTALILPAQTGSAKIQALLELSKPAMATLQRDMGFLGFVEGMIQTERPVFFRTPELEEMAREPSWAKLIEAISA